MTETLTEAQMGKLAAKWDEHDCTPTGCWYCAAYIVALQAYASDLAQQLAEKTSDPPQP